MGLSLTPAHGCACSHARTHTHTQQIPSVGGSASDGIKTQVSNNASVWTVAVAC